MTLRQKVDNILKSLEKEGIYFEEGVVEEVTHKIQSGKQLDIYKARFDEDEGGLANDV